MGSCSLLYFARSCAFDKQQQVLMRLLLIPTLIQVPISPTIHPGLALTLKLSLDKPSYSQAAV